MAGKVDDDDDASSSSTRANDWEVVSLTASAYAASPGPKPLDLIMLIKHHDDDDDDDDVKEALTPPPPPPHDSPQTSPHPLYMSRHFVFPPTSSSVDVLQNPPADTTSELLTEGPSKKLDFGFSVEQETGSALKKDVGDLSLKGFELDLSHDDDDVFSGLDFSEDKAKTHDNNNNNNNNNHIYKTAMSSLHDETTISAPIQEPTEPAATSPSHVSSHLNPPTKDENYDAPPCQAWWKRSAASLIAQAKETNTVWSISIAAAAVMGIVILGQHWQQERWQILHLKWESTIGNEKAGRLMGPISRLKQAFLGGQRRDSFIRGASSHNDR